MKPKNIYNNRNNELSHIDKTLQLMKEDKALNILHMVTQAIGRCFRTTFLSPQMTLSVHKDVMFHLSSIAFHKDFEKIPKNALLKALEEKAQADFYLPKDFMYKKQKEFEENELANKSNRLNQYMEKSLLNTIWNSKEEDLVKLSKDIYNQHRSLIMKHGKALSKQQYEELLLSEELNDNLKQLLEVTYVKISKTENGNLSYYYKNKKSNFEEVFLASDTKTNSFKHFSLNEDDQTQFENISFKDKEFKSYCDKKGFSTSLEVNENDEEAYVLNPYAYSSLYKGILKEEHFLFISNKYNLRFENIDNIKQFERADFISQNKKVAVDVKGYEDAHKDLSQNIEKNILNTKADLLEVDAYILINMDPVQGDGNSYQPFKKNIVTKGGRNLKIIGLQMLLTDGISIYYNQNAIKLLEELK